LPAENPIKQRTAKKYQEPSEPVWQDIINDENNRKENKERKRGEKHLDSWF